MAGATGQNKRRVIDICITVRAVDPSVETRNQRDSPALLGDCVGRLKAPPLPANTATPQDFTTIFEVMEWLAHRLSPTLFLRNRGAIPSGKYQDGRHAIRGHAACKDLRTNTRHSVHPLWIVCLLADPIMSTELDNPSKALSTLSNQGIMR